MFAFSQSDNFIMDPEISPDASKSEETNDKLHKTKKDKKKKKVSFGVLENWMLLCVLRCGIRYF